MSWLKRNIITQKPPVSLCLWGLACLGSFFTGAYCGSLYKHSHHYISVPGDRGVLIGEYDEEERAKEMCSWLKRHKMRGITVKRDTHTGPRYSVVATCHSKEGADKVKKLLERYGTYGKSDFARQGHTVTPK